MNGFNGKPLPIYCPKCQRERGVAIPANCPHQDEPTPSPIEEVRQEIEQREANAGSLVDVPFSLTPPVSERKGFQTRMF